MPKKPVHCPVIPVLGRMRHPRRPCGLFVGRPYYHACLWEGRQRAVELCDPSLIPLRCTNVLCIVIIYLLLGFPFASLSISAAQAPVDDWTEQHFRIAREAERQNDFDKAAAEYELIVSHSPRFAGAYLNLGIIYHHQRRYADAAKVLKTAVALDSQLLGAQLILGVDYYLTGDFKSALPHLKQALQLKPTDRQAGFYLGLTYTALGAPVQAAAALRKTAEYYPDDLEIAYQLGLAYLEAMKQESARVNETGDQSALFHWAVAIAAEEKSNQGQAVTEYMKALALDPNLADLYRKLAVTFQHSGFPELAATALLRYKVLRPGHKVVQGQAQESSAEARPEEKVLSENKDAILQLWQKIPSPRYDPMTPAVADSFVNQALKVSMASAVGPTLNAALRLYAQGDYLGAARTIADSKTRGAAWPVAYLWASAYQQAMQSDAAERVVEEWLLPHLDVPSISLLAIEIQRRLASRYFDQVVEKQPNSYQAKMLLAKSRSAARRDSEALSAYREALRMAPNQLGIHLAIGEVYENQLHWVPAIEEFKAELALDPANAMALAHLGHALTEAREPDQAIPVLETLLKTNPTDGQACSDLGKDWEAKGEKEKAIDAYQRALVQDPTQTELHYRLFQLYRKSGQQGRAEKELALFKEAEAHKHTKFQQGMAALK